MKSVSYFCKNHKGHCIQMWSMLFHSENKRGCKYSWMLLKIECFRVMPWLLYLRKWDCNICLPLQRAFGFICEEHHVKNWPCPLVAEHESRYFMHCLKIEKCKLEKSFYVQAGEQVWKRQRKVIDFYNSFWCQKVKLKFVLNHFLFCSFDLLEKQLISCVILCGLCFLFYLRNANRGWSTGRWKEGVLLQFEWC